MSAKNKRSKQGRPPTHSSWTIKDFPVRLRLKFAAYVKIKGTTIPAQMEEVVKTFLELPEKEKPSALQQQPQP